MKSKRYLKEDKGGCVNVTKITNSDYEYKVDMKCNKTENSCSESNPEVKKLCFTDSTNECKEMTMDKIKEAKLSVNFTGGYDDKGEELTINGYSYSILMETTKKPVMHEVYNSGTLYANDAHEVRIDKKVTDYVSLVDATSIKVKLTIINSKGCKIEEEATNQYHDSTAPQCNKISGEAEENDWIKKDDTRTRVITAFCEDGAGSGCLRPTFSRSWPNDNQPDAEYTYINVQDNAGNFNVAKEKADAKTEDLCKQAEEDTRCKVRVNVDKTLPTIKVLGAYKRSDADKNKNEYKYDEGEPNVLKSTTYTVNDTSEKGTGTIGVSGYKNLVNDWMNSTNYPAGVVYEVEISDALHLSSWTWRTNAGDITNTNSEAYTTYGTGDISDTSYSGKKYPDTTENHCGSTRTDKILIGFAKEGKRQGELIVKDKAGNTTKLIISANLDRTAPPVPTVSYKKANTSASYTPGTAVSNWSREKIKTYISTTITKEISGWESFEYWYRKQNAVNNTEATTANSLAAAVTGTTKSSTTSTSFTLESNPINDEGRHLFKARSRDVAGNWSKYSSEDTVKVDTVKPTCTSAISYPYGGPTSEGWLGINSTNSYDSNGTYKEATNGKKTAIVKQVCKENGNYGSQCNSATISQYEYKTPMNITNAGAMGAGKGGTIKDIAGNEQTCPANQTVRIDYAPPTCVVTGEAKNSSDWATSRTIKRQCSDTKRSGHSEDTISGCRSGLTKSESFGGKKTNHNLVDKVMHTYSFPTNAGYTITDKAGNKKYCYSPTVKVYVDRRAPDCTYKVTHTYTTDGVTITFTCNDKYKDLSGVGIKTYPGGKDHKVTNKKSNYTAEAIDKLGNRTTYTVKIHSQKQYKKRSCNTCNSCNSSACTSWSTTYAIKTAATCKRPAHPSNCNIIGGNRDTTMCCKTGTTCTGHKRDCNKCSCQKWGSYSSKWSTKNHCKNYKNSKTCQQKSRTVYY